MGVGHGHGVLVRVIQPRDLLDTEELAGLLGVSASTLRVMRSKPGAYRQLDGLPQPLRRVSDRPVWARAAVEAWLARSTNREEGT